MKIYYIFNTICLIYHFPQRGPVVHHFQLPTYFARLTASKVIYEDFVCTSVFPIIHIILFIEIVEVHVFPNSTTILFDNLRLKIYFNSNNYSDS